MGKSCSFGLQYVFCTMSSLNKGDVNNCRLYVTIEIGLNTSSLFM